MSQIDSNMSQKESAVSIIELPSGYIDYKWLIRLSQVLFKSKVLLDWGGATGSSAEDGRSLHERGAQNDSEGEAGSARIKVWTDGRG